MVHADFCQAWPTSLPWYPADSQLLLASRALLWVPPDTTTASWKLLPRWELNAPVPKVPLAVNVWDCCLSMLPSKNCVDAVWVLVKNTGTSDSFSNLLREVMCNTVCDCVGGTKPSSWEIIQFCFEMHLCVLKHYFSVVLKKKKFSASENKQVIGKRAHFVIKLFCFSSNRMYLRQIVLIC